jgi:UDP-2-acetamido-3-amino-2,3-dideoxy-glucuronate N-acetyltransferase
VPADRATRGRAGAILPLFPDGAWPVRRNLAVVGDCGRGALLSRAFSRLGALRGDELPKHDLDEVLNDPGIECVVVATPAESHYEHCRAVLAAGRDVFVEQPLALDVDHADELVALAEDQSRILQVGYSLRYHPAILRLHELISSGSLGRVEYAYSNRLGTSRMRPDENLLWSFAPDDIAVILGLLDGSPVRASAHGEAFLGRDASDVTLTSLEFPGNVRAHTFVSWLHPFAEQRLVVVGSQAMAVFDGSLPDGALATCERGDQPLAEPCAGQPAVGTAQLPGRPVPFRPAEPIIAECEHFLDCCLNRIPPRTDGHEGLAVLRVLAAAEQSLRSHGRVVGITGMPVRGRGLPLSGQIVADAVAGAVDVRVRPTPAPSTSACATQDVSLPTRAPVAARPAVNGAHAAIHPSAIIDATADVGLGTAVARDVHVGRCVCIGPANTLGPAVSIAEHVRTGAGCRIERNTIVCSRVTLEDGVVCGPGSVFTEVAGGPPAGSEPTLVRRGAVIGANATVESGRKLGRYSRVAAAAVVTEDVPDYALVGGVPAKQQGWVCACGADLRFESGAAACARCGMEYELADGAVRPRPND